MIVKENWSIIKDKKEQKKVLHCFFKQQLQKELYNELETPNLYNENIYELINATKSNNIDKGIGLKIQ